MTYGGGNMSQFQMESFRALQIHTLDEAASCVVEDSPVGHHFTLRGGPLHDDIMLWRKTITPLRSPP